jgi:plastocyanin
MLIQRNILVALIMMLLCLTARAATHQVGIQDSFYEPFQLAINVGDTVVWTEYGGQDHTVTSDDGFFDVVMPFGETFAYTFNQAGSYPYYCINHGGPGGEGMSGTIVVSASTANQPPGTPVNQSPSAGATNQPLTVQLRAGAFSDPDPQDFHGASQWLVRRVADNQIVFNSGEDALNRTNRIVPDGALGYASNYAWQVRYKDGRGLWSQYSAATTFTTLVPVTQVGIGLRAGFCNVPNLDAPLAITTNAVIDFHWGNARPHRRITADAFAVRWEGSVLPQFTERYFFQFQFHGRARVWVNQQLLIDEWNGCGFGQTRRGSIDLVGGQLAALRVEYAADAAGALATLRWTSPSQPLQVVPTTRLFPPTTP